MTLFLLFAVALGSARPVGAQEPGLLEIIPYQASEYKFQVVPQRTQPPPGFEQPGFNDFSFNTGSAGFGSGGNCSFQSTVQTVWPTNSQLVVRRNVFLPEGTTDVRVIVSVDNDIIGVFFEGTPLIEHTRRTRKVIHEGCPLQDEFRFDVPQELVQPGENLVAFHVLDRGVESFFDAKILAAVPPDQLKNAAVVQQAPLVPISDTTITCPLPLPGNAQPPRPVRIDYLVDATGEPGSILFAHDSFHSFSMDAFLGGEFMASTSANITDQLTAQITLSPRLKQRISSSDTLASSPTNQVASALDQGALSIDTILGRPFVVDALFACITPRVAESCKDDCENTETLLTLANVAGGALTALSHGLAIPNTLGVAYLQKKIDRRADVCKGGCGPTPPPPGGGGGGGGLVVFPDSPGQSCFQEACQTAGESSCATMGKSVASVEVETTSAPGGPNQRCSVTCEGGSAHDVAINPGEIPTIGCRR